MNCHKFPVFLCLIVLENRFEIADIELEIAFVRISQDPDVFEGWVELRILVDNFLSYLRVELEMLVDEVAVEKDHNERVY